MGSGTAANALTFSSSGGGGGGGKGKPGGGGGSTTTPTSLQLRVLASDGTVLAAGTGPSVLQFASTLPAGTYTWEVVGHEFRELHADRDLRGTMSPEHEEGARRRQAPSFVRLQPDLR